MLCWTFIQPIKTNVVLDTYSANQNQCILDTYSTNQNQYCIGHLFNQSKPMLCWALIQPVKTNVVLDTYWANQNHCCVGHLLSQSKPLLCWTLFSQSKPMLCWTLFIMVQYNTTQHNTSPHEITSCNEESRTCTTQYNKTRHSRAYQYSKNQNKKTLKFAPRTQFQVIHTCMVQFLIHLVVIGSTCLIWSSVMSLTIQTVSSFFSWWED